MRFPPHGEKRKVPGRGLGDGAGRALALRAAARLRRPGRARRCSTTCSASRSRAPAPTARSRGRWTSRNPASGDEFVLGLKEIQLPDGTTRPYSIWLSGHYPRALDGLTRILSLDMRVVDPAWIGMKLRKLLDYSEPLGDFMAFVPGRAAPAELALDRRLPRAPRDPPLRDARRARRARLSRRARWASSRRRAPTTSPRS